MAPERSGSGRGKTKLLLRQKRETTNLERLNNFEKRIKQMNEVENTPLEKRNKEHY